MSVGGQYNLSVRDYGGQIGSTTILTGAVTAVSLPGLLTQYGALRTAIAGIIDGVPSSENAHVFDTILSAAEPTSEYAQRGTKWIVNYHDNLQFFDAPVNAIPNAGYLKPFSIELPTAKLSLLEEGSEELDLSVTAVAAFVTAFEAIARSPYNGTVEVDSIKYVPRSV